VTPLAPSFLLPQPPNLPALTSVRHLPNPRDQYRLNNLSVLRRIGLFAVSPGAQVPFFFLPGSVSESTLGWESTFVLFVYSGRFFCRRSRSNLPYPFFKDFPCIGTPPPPPPPPPPPTPPPPPPPQGRFLVLLLLFIP